MIFILIGRKEHGKACSVISMKKGTGVSEHTESSW